MNCVTLCENGRMCLRLIRISLCSTWCSSELTAATQLSNSMGSQSKWLIDTKTPLYRYFGRM